MNSHIKDLLSFLDASPTPFQASQQIVLRLDKAGYTQLNETANWSLKPGGKYYVQRNGTAVLAFSIGSAKLEKEGFLLAASHIDSPLFKLKPQSLKTENSVTRIGVEVYGSPIIGSWIDRELSIAGRVLVKKGSVVSAHSVDLKVPVAVIPNAALHLNRTVNKDFEYNRQTHLQAILNTSTIAGDPLLAALAEHLKVSPEQIVEQELYLYDPKPATLAGLDSSLVISGRLDNLAMTHAILRAMLELKTPKHTCVAAFYDHEEIGSQTPQGAFSSFLTEILERITLALKLSREQYYQALRNSFLISADMAHAFHPSYPEKYDPNYSPKMNQGPALKLNASLRYTTTAPSAARFAALCEAAGVEYQKFILREDLPPAGTTVGPLISALLGIPAVDIGNPMWAMHSARETAGVCDHKALIKVLASYFI